MTALNPRRVRLAATLKILRQAAMPSGSEMARRTGWVQPKVSRLETGAQLPTEDDLRTWAQHTGASSEQTEALLEMLFAAGVEYTDYTHTADLLAGGALARRQARIEATEAAARIVAARGKRQALLSEPGRRWQFVIGETALWSSPGTAEIQLEQLDCLVVVSTLPGVELGVIPLRAPMPVLPLSGIRLLDDEFVFVESLAGE